VSEGPSAAPPTAQHAGETSGSEPADEQIAQIERKPHEGRRDRVLVLHLNEEKIAPLREPGHDLSEPLPGRLHVAAGVGKPLTFPAAQHDTPIVQEPGREPSEVDLGANVWARAGDQVEPRLLDHVVKPIDVPVTGEVVAPRRGGVVAPGVVNVDGVQPRVTHSLDTIAPELSGGEPEVRKGSRADQPSSAVDQEARAVELDVQRPTPTRAPLASARRRVRPCTRFRLL
jgi:hypothetical protein